MPAQRTAPRSNTQHNLRPSVRSKPLAAVLEEERRAATKPRNRTSISLHSLSASVVVDSKKVPCYGLEVNEAERVVTCFIESQVGKSYKVCVQRRQNAKTNGKLISARLYVDGSDDSAFGAKLEEHQGSSLTIPGAIDHRDNVRSLQFSGVETTDDGSSVTRSTDTDHIGRIEVEFRKSKIRSRPGSPWRDFEPPDRTIVREEKKLAGYHATSLGPLQEAATVEMSTRKTDVVEEIKEPENAPYFVKLVFHYRPRNILVAENIIPNTEAALQTKNRASEPPVEELVKQEGGDGEDRADRKEGDDKDDKGDRKDGDNGDEDYDVEMLKAEAQEAAGRAQEAAGHAAVLAAEAKKAALVLERAKGKGKSKNRGSTVVKDQDDIIDLTHL